ncbi:MAG: type 1 glutamine amidotransferase [Bdellovibrionota bacterium]
MKALIFQHTEEENPGTLLDWFARSDWKCEVHHWYRGGPTPAPDLFDWLIVLGGPMNLDQEKEFPWLRAEKAYVKGWLANGRPLLGICLGAQIIAQSLGGRVSLNPEREIGFHSVEKFAGNFPAFRRWPGSLPVYQYHEDTFSLAEGCTRLASSVACANQAFSFGRKNKILALQFHPESSAEWIAGNAASIEKKPGETFVQTPEETAKLVPALLPPMTGHFHNLLDDFVAGWKS